MMNPLQVLHEALRGFFFGGGTEQAACKGNRARQDQGRFQGSKLVGGWGTLLGFSVLTLASCFWFQLSIRVKSGPIDCQISSYKWVSGDW